MENMFVYDIDKEIICDYVMLTTLYLEDHYCVFLLGTVNRINVKYTNSIILK